MTTRDWGIKYPEKFLFETSPTVAGIFRRHCAVNQYKISRVLNDLIIDYLIKVEEIPSRESLEIQEQMEK